MSDESTENSYSEYSESGSNSESSSSQGNQLPIDNMAKRAAAIKQLYVKYKTAEQQYFDQIKRTMEQYIADNFEMKPDALLTMKAFIGFFKGNELKDVEGPFLIKCFCELTNTKHIVKGNMPINKTVEGVDLESWEEVKEVISGVQFKKE